MAGFSLKGQVPRGMIPLLHPISPYEPLFFASNTLTYPAKGAMAATPYDEYVNAAILNNADIINSLL